MKASKLNCSLLIEESQNASFLILASDKPENHTKKGKGVGIAKIERSGSKKAEKGKDNGCTLSFHSGYLFGDTVVFETKNWRNDNEDFSVFQNLARE